MPKPLALVLSGGSVRAAAQVGVLKALEEYNLRPTVVVGTSGGSIVAALYAAGMTASGIEKLFTSFKDKKDAIVDLNWLGVLEGLTKKDYGKMSGLVKGDALKKVIHENLPKAKTFPELASKAKHDDRLCHLMIPAVNLNDGKQTIFTDAQWLAGIKLDKNREYRNFRINDQASIAEAVRASISIPGVFVPAKGKQDDHFVDGGVRNGYPLSVAVKLAGCDEIIGVNLGYAGMRRDKVVEQGATEILAQSLDIMMRGQYKDMLYDNEVKQSKIITINPLIYDVSTFEVEYVPEMIERGYQVARNLFKAKGLVQGGSASRNRKLLFTNLSGAWAFPEKNSELFQELLDKQIKDKVPKQANESQIAKIVAKVANSFRLAGVLVVSTFVLASGGLLLWIVNQSNWTVGLLLLTTAATSGYLLYRQGSKVVEAVLS